MEYPYLGNSGFKVPLLSYGAGTFGGKGPLFSALGSHRCCRSPRFDRHLAGSVDAMTPVEMVLSTLDDLVRDGKVRYIGVSNFSGWQLMKSLAIADRYGYSRYVANHTSSPLMGRDYEWELMPLGLDQGVGAIVWSPLGWGRLTGKIRRGQSRPATS